MEWILSYINWANDNKREIFSSYPSEDAAIDAMNNELIAQFMPESGWTDDEYERIFCRLDCEIEQVKKLKKL